MKRVVGRLKTGWLSVAGLVCLGFIFFVLLTPGSAAIAATPNQSPPKIYYDSPHSGDGMPAAYVVGVKWEKLDLTYSFSNCPSLLACDVAQQQVIEAIEAWDAVCGLTITGVASEGDIRIGWYSDDHGDGNPFDGPGHVLAHAFFPLPFLGDLGGDVHFDDTETWVVGQPTAPRQFHLKTTAMHELGHALGLDHSADPAALMWDQYTGLRTIGPDDIAGIQSLYGPPGPDEGSVAPPAPVGVMATATTTVRVRSGPGTDFAQVGTVDAGATVPVLGRNAASDWLYVDSSGTRGWVAAFLFSIQGDLNSVPVVDQNGGGADAPPPSVTPLPGPQPTPIPPAIPGAVTGTATTTVRIRTGPGTNYPPVGAVDSGMTVSIVARNPSGSWVYVQTQTLQGWAATWLFTVTGDLNSLPVRQPQF